MQLTSKFIKYSKAIFVFYYLVGAVGIALPQTTNFVKSLTPYTLLMTYVFLAIFHQSHITKTTLFVFAAIALFGFLAEMIGVNTGLLFGNYIYGDGLGFKLHHTPILIAFNWLFLVYATASLFHQWQIGNIWKVVLPSLTMLVYDLVLEQVAPKLDMWSWQNNIIPLQNYVCWFILSALFHSAIVGFKVKTHNPLALIVLATQFIFLVYLYIATP